MSDTQTEINLLAAQEFAARIAANLPNGWAAPDALTSGNWNALLVAIGGEMNQIQQSLLYTLNATRLTTETSPELDLASVDFFGGSFPRPAGMSDSAFASAIIANLFKNAATRPAISAALLQLTGFTPRMMEPWSIFDTGVWDRTTYWDVDIPPYTGRWGTGSVSDFWSGFIETPAPAIPLLGPNIPILGFDTTAYWDHPGYFFADLESNQAQSVDGVVNKLRAFGVTAWVKIVNAPSSSQGAVLPSAPTGLIVSIVSATSLMVVWTAPATGTVPFNYTVNYRVTGTQTFQSGAASSVPSAVLSGLQPNTHYDIVVIARNAAGAGPQSAIAQGTTPKQAPAPATNLTATQVQATAVTLSWTAPASGTPPFTYTVLYRVAGTIPFNQFTVGLATAVTVIGLQPGTTYDFEVQSSTT